MLFHSMCQLQCCCNGVTKIPRNSDGTLRCHNDNSNKLTYSFLFIYFLSPSSPPPIFSCFFLHFARKLLGDPSILVKGNVLWKILCRKFTLTFQIGIFHFVRFQAGWNDSIFISAHKYMGHPEGDHCPKWTWLTITIASKKLKKKSEKSEEREKNARERGKERKEERKRSTADGRMCVTTALMHVNYSM